MASIKRARGSPTGQTPKKPPKSSKHIVNDPQRTGWTPSEDATLVQYVCDEGFFNVWPKARASHSIWERASSSLADHGHKTKRTSGSCRARVATVLSKKFNSPHDAMLSMSNVENEHSSYSPIQIEHVAVGAQDTPESSLSSIPIEREDSIMDSYCRLSSDEQLSLVCDMFAHTATSKFGLAVPNDFLAMALKGMQNLSAAGRSNVICTLCKGLGSFRPGNSKETYFPTSRMPMGLLEYMVNFFTSEHGNTVKCPSDYSQWLQSMFSLFGSKWCKLHRGPGWSYEATEQGSRPFVEDLSPLAARVNVPAPSDRTLQRAIASSDITVTAEVQEKILDEAHHILPNTRWWIKGDGVDLTCCLQESVAGEWNGDVDLGDGKLQLLRLEYLRRLKSIPRVGDAVSAAHIQHLIHSVEQDLNKIYNLLEKANKTYEQQLQSGKANKATYSAGWKVEELSKLNEEGRRIIVEMKTTAQSMPTDLTIEKGHKLQKLGVDLSLFIKGYFRHQRTAATHAYAVLISPEDRKRKPYALPVQLIPYVGMGTEEIRKVLNNLTKKMYDKGMKVAGFVSNGEHNVLRATGYTRPVSLFKIRSSVRAKYAKMSAKKLHSMITPVENSDPPVAQADSPVPQEVLREIVGLQKSGLSFDDIVSRLRSRTVPCGYPVHSWRDGEAEDTTDKLRSIIAQFEFSKTVKSWDAHGVPFSTYFYVPEEHPVLKTVFNEREDEGHVFKRIGHSTRRGGPDNMKLERFNEALYDPATKLTYPALTGQRKQSIRDVEILFSEGVEKFMEKRGYQVEAEYVRAIRHWRLACDQRGLNQLQRCRYNYELLSLILSELLPWYEDVYDLSTLEVTRPISGILGMTRETIIALTTNIESREWRRRENQEPEHPRASTTDDVECLFSIMRDMVGSHFTLQCVKYNWRKVCNEFRKRLDPTLPFYYHTSTHDRFYEGDRPSFDEFQGHSSKNNPRGQRPRVVEQLSHMAGRVTLPTPGSRSTRNTYHNKPIELPPPPSQVNPLSEHNYV